MQNLAKLGDLPIFSWCVGPTSQFGAKSGWTLLIPFLCTIEIVKIFNMDKNTFGWFPQGVGGIGSNMCGVLLAMDKMLMYKFDEIW